VVAFLEPYQLTEGMYAIVPVFDGKAKWGCWFQNFPTDMFRMNQVLFYLGVKALSTKSYVR
jgi:hypothetical protein